MIQIAQLQLLEERAQCMRKGCPRCVAFGSGYKCNNSGALPGALLDSAAAAAAAAGSKKRPAVTVLLAEALAESAAATVLLADALVESAAAVAVAEE